MSEERKQTEMIVEITLEEFTKAFRVMKPMGSKILGTIGGLAVLLLGAYLALPQWEHGIKAMIPGILVAAVAVFYLVYDHYLFYRSSVKKKYQKLCKAEGTKVLTRKLTLREEDFTYEAAGIAQTYSYDQIRRKYRLGITELWICGNQMIFKKEK